MTTIHLNRWASGPMGVFGEMEVTNGFHCWTVERPWMDNKPLLSCIPVGVYEVVRERYHKGGYDALQLLNVPDRSEILIHAANTMDDLQGCIGVGSSFGMVKGKWAVLNSRSTLDALLESLGLLGNIEIRIAWRLPS